LFAATAGDVADWIGLPRAPSRKPRRTPAAQPARLQAAQARAARHAGDHELAEAARLILAEAEVPAPDGRLPERTAWCPGETEEVAS
jgi:hypothetical protein